MSDHDSDAFSTILAFEQVLEVMPDDRGALEEVTRAYEEMGDQAQSRVYNVRLIRVLIDEGDVDTAAECIDKLRVHAAEDEEIAKLIEEVDALCGGTAPAARPASGEDGNADAAAETATKSRRSGVRMHLNAADEMAFAWNLLEKQLLTDQDYADVVQDLTELASGNQAGTVSVLHILQDRGFKGLDKILMTVARETGLPVIQLTQFEFQRDTAQMLPMEFIVNRGVLPFENMGSEVLLAVLNPYDEVLRKDAKTLLDRRCHWFLTPPPGFDYAVQRFKDLLNAGSA